MTRVRVRQPFDAPLERAWAACTEPHRIQCWQADEASGAVNVGQTLVLGWPALGARVALEVIAVEAPRRLVIGGGESRVEITLEPGAIALSHDGVADGDEAEGVASSWRISLALFAHYLERHWDQPRRVRWSVGKARTTAAAAHVFFTERAALGTWLAQRGEIGATGSRYSLVLAWGAPMSGRVLAHTPDRDLIVSWDEDRESTLAFRTLPRARDSEERIFALVWSRFEDTEAPREMCRGFDAALERLVHLVDRPAMA